PTTWLCFPKLPDILPKCRCPTAPPFVPGEASRRLPESSGMWWWFSARNCMRDSLRGLRQTLSRSWRELEEMQLHPPKSVEAAKRKVDKIRRHQYLRSLLCYEVTRDGRGPIRIRLWTDWQEYQRLTTRYFGLLILIPA